MNAVGEVEGDTVTGARVVGFPESNYACIYPEKKEEKITHQWLGSVWVKRWLAPWSGLSDGRS